MKSFLIFVNAEKALALAYKKIKFSWAQESNVRNFLRESNLSFIEVNPVELKCERNNFGMIMSQKLNARHIFDAKTYNDASPFAYMGRPKFT